RVKPHTPHRFSDGWRAVSPAPRENALGSAGVVGGLHDHLDVVGMRLLETCGGDAHELAALLQLADGASAHVEHRLTEAAHELVDDGAERAAVGHTTFDALRDELRI